MTSQVTDLRESSAHQPDANTRVRPRTGGHRPGVHPTWRGTATATAPPEGLAVDCRRRGLIVALAGAGASALLLADRNGSGPQAQRPAGATVVDEEDAPPPATGTTYATHGLMGDAADGQRLRCEGGSWRAALPDPGLGVFHLEDPVLVLPTPSLSPVRG